MSQLCFVMSDLLRGLWLTSKNSHIRKFIESAQQCGLFGYYMYHANYVSSTLLPLMCSWYGIKWSQSFIPKLVNCFANLHVYIRTFPIQARNQLTNYFCPLLYAHTTYSLEMEKHMYVLYMTLQYMSCTCTVYVHVHVRTYQQTFQSTCITVIRIIT